MTLKRYTFADGTDQKMDLLGVGEADPEAPQVLADEAAPKEPSSCAAKPVLSHEEEAVLKIMRGYTGEARALRAELKTIESAIDPDTEEPRRLAITERLELLRLLFREQKIALRLANEEKLRRLGHLP